MHTNPSGLKAMGAVGYMVWESLLPKNLACLDRQGLVGGEQ